MTALVQLRRKTDKRSEHRWSKARLLAEAPPDHSALRPRTRAECIDGPRPCPWVSCRYHLALEVGASGSITIRHPIERDDPDARRCSPAYDAAVDWDAIDETCVLDVAARGGLTLEEIGELMGLTREAVRLIETSGLAEMKNDARLRAWRRNT